MDKSRLHQLVDDSPDDVEIDQFMERLYLLAKLEDSERAIAEGRVIPHEEVREHLKPWL